VSAHSRFVICAAVLFAPAFASRGQATGPAVSEAQADSLFSAREFARALAAYEALTRQDSTSARLWYQVGLSAAFTGKPDRAATAFERSATITPNPSALYNVGAMHARMHHADSAFAWLERAVKVGFGNPAVLQSDQDLAGIRSDPRFAALLKAASTPPAPCMSNPDYRRFDFWVGEWDVTTRGGVAVGKSSVQSVSGGCGLLENWTAKNGAQGKSLNSFSPQTRQWRQFWVGQAGALVDYSESEWNDGAVTFFARGRGFNAAIQRLTFSALNDSTVRQLGEASSDGGQTWKINYDLYYHRRR
jgi:tetratricopeptide (TPR) repeat protein